MIKTRHLGVYGIATFDDKVLLVKKARGAYIGKYDLPGGSIEHGEKPIETLHREFLEETGMKITNANILNADSVVVEWYDHEHHDDTQSMHHIGIMYDVQLEPGNIKTSADGLDSLGAKWYPISELTKDNISPLAYETLKLKKLIKK